MKHLATFGMLFAIPVVAVVWSIYDHRRLTKNCVAKGRDLDAVGAMNGGISRKMYFGVIPESDRCYCARIRRAFERKHKMYF